MALRLHDTLTKKVRDFVPVIPGTVSIYLCGATVQGLPHIGHVRSAISFDILRRWLEADGFDVLFVRNVTDIDDKILAKAAEAGRPWWEWATTHERAFNDAYAALGVLPPSAEPHATGYITQMWAYIERMIKNGSAYAAENDDPTTGSDVYFDVRSLPNYGALSGNRLEDVVQGEDSLPGKRDPRDFTLWKSAKPGEPSWPSPWGPGRPGWHLECSAMATGLLGAEFDIHGGGLDLVFPHHENELAQAHGAGDGFARFWMHNGWVTMAGEKMSKSLGNTVSVPNMLTLVRPIELRYYLGSVHYSSMLEYSEKALREAATGFTRIESFLERAGVLADGASKAGQPSVGRPVTQADVPAEFAAALDDNLAVPAAIAVLHETVRAGNAALERADADPAEVAMLAAQVRAMVQVLGVDPAAPNWISSAPADDRALDVLVAEALARRATARTEKDWAAADAARDLLNRAGIEVIDSPDGSTWRRATHEQEGA